MTENIFFDSDCLSAFLWVDQQENLSKLYSNRIIIPQQTYDELSNPSIPHLKTKIDRMLNNNDAILCDMDINSPEYKLFMQLSANPEINDKIIGKGEATSIALSKEKQGILASNNLADISSYVKKYNLKHVTTGIILIEMYHNKIITKDDGNKIWQSMLSKRRKLGAATFNDYLNNYYAQHK